MILEVYSVFDAQAGLFIHPLYAVTRGQAQRSFADMVQDPSAPFAKHPGDYHLYRLGSFDDQSGRISGLADQDGAALPPDLIIRGDQL